MRTTIVLPDELLAEVKKRAAESNTTMTAIIEEAVRERLSRRERGRPAKQVSLTTYGSLGTQPGVDLNDSAAMLDLMEGDSVPDRR